MLRVPNTIALETIRITPDIDWSLRHYRKLAEQGEVAANHVRTADYRRWSFVYDMIPSGVTLMDIGVGAGQFVNAAGRSQRFESVMGVDYRYGSGLKQVSSHWTLVIQSLAARRIPASLTAQVVTCMECIEHIADPLFDVAVANLKRMATERLIVTVPFEEKLPLPRYHKQRFDMGRLNRLFPGGEVTLITWRETPLWAAVDWRPDAVQSRGARSAQRRSGISGSPQAMPAIG